MDVVALAMWLLAFILGWRAYSRPQKLHIQGAIIAWESIRVMLPQIVMAILISGFFSVIVPTELVANWLGKDSGAKGILIGSLTGGLTPGGPIICLPIVAIIFKAGAGLGPIIAFLTAWSIFAIHRVFAYEIPLMGVRFVMIRLLSSVILPPLAGILAAIWENLFLA
ncbi:MAG: permease [Calditrichales bacterium]|nr:MAG: permease [Calditrichales bacterium]